MIVQPCQLEPVQVELSSQHCPSQFQTFRLKNIAILFASHIHRKSWEYTCLKVGGNRTIRQICPNVEILSCIPLLLQIFFLPFDYLKDHCTHTSDLVTRARCRHKKSFPAGISSPFFYYPRLMYSLVVETEIFFKYSTKHCIYSCFKTHKSCKICNTSVACIPHSPIFFCSLASISLLTLTMMMDAVDRELWCINIMHPIDSDYGRWRRWQIGWRRMRMRMRMMEGEDDAGC